MAEEALRAKAVLDNKAWNSALASMQSKSQVFMRASKVAFKGAVDAGKELGTQMLSIGKYAAAGVTAVAGAMSMMVKHAMSSGDELVKLSEKTGLAIPFLNRMKYAANQGETSLEGLATGFKFLQKAMVSATEGDQKLNEDGQAKIAKAKMQAAEEIASVTKEENKKLAASESASASSRLKLEQATARKIEKARERLGDRKNKSRNAHDLNSIKEDAAVGMQSGMDSILERKIKAENTANERIAQVKQKWAERMAEIEGNVREKSDEGAKAMQAFRDLGVAVTDASGKLRSTEAVFTDAAEAISKVQDDATRTALSLKVFGKSGAELIPFLRAGKEQMKAWSEESDKLAYSWTETTARAADALGHSFGRLWIIATGLMDRFGVGLFQSIQDITTGIQGWYEANKQVIDQKVEDFAARVADGIAATWETVKNFYNDGGFVLWWERAKLAVLGLKVTLAGVQSALDYTIAGFYAYLAVQEATTFGGTMKKSGEYWGKAKEYEGKATTRSQGAVGEYAAQAMVVKGAQDNMANQQTKRQVTAQKAAAAGGTVVNVTVNNQGVGNMSSRDAIKIHEAITKRMARGQINTKSYGTIGELRQSARDSGYQLTGG